MLSEGQMFLKKNNNFTCYVKEISSIIGENTVIHLEL